MPDPEEVLRAHTLAAADDPSSDIVWAGRHEHRWGLRMAQRCRDFTTVWFDAGQRTVRFEAYVIGRPPSAAAEVYRQCLARNRETLFARFALDPDGDLVLCGRVPNDLVTPIVIDTVIGEVYQLVEVAFRPMVRAMGREKNA
ncbi:MAG: YbjN domain-containing protein [Acidimicrobiia bacterium]|nr:YbjN domain-containing protein [Acidimicrobiia bacterium]NNF70310.1 YbjN domain-containing protein [Acidimicrobiia bacterium]